VYRSGEGNGVQVLIEADSTAIKKQVVESK